MLNNEIYERLIDTLKHDLYSHKVLHEISVMATSMADFYFITWEQNAKIQKIIHSKEKGDIIND